MDDLDNKIQYMDVLYFKVRLITLIGEESCSKSNLNIGATFLLVRFLWSYKENEHYLLKKKAP
jgi:hypothetical protein